jgi:hypothetical protein
MDRLGFPKPARHRIRPALRSELAAVRAIEREAAQRFEGTAEAWIAQDPPAPEALLDARLEAGLSHMADHGD